ncbi:signal transduction histidine kinase [Gottschalkia acidurici 9a]|uniref:histidine kinase n=1 Tax=Gottschalkia acidurici (strain ATCC 7906 / DSM 604 / BCRC 14475 / CIP 104303 / KCTC 5404 / NCIMB 10678 / 9a) TaxID=1128398 RepID=K0AYP2_GOTA9|nr:HAMP domain-containing sensor histidine kinase [Gottschalkia acidurici]AFS77536.1 signal transduction histidine kinase [Gottschalkia acidurici 9a]
MKFSYKIFISTLLLIMFTLSIGETIMLTVTFNNAIDSEIEHAQRENLMMRMEIATLVRNYNRAIYRNEREALDSVLETLSENWKKEKRQFRIIDKNNRVITESQGFTDFINMNNVANIEEELNYKIYRDKESYYVQVNTLLKLNEKEIIIENSKNLSSVFSYRKEQQTIFLQVALVIGGIGGLINWVVVRWISKPINEMTKAMKKIMSGNLTVRVENKSTDELGTLANYFNSMTESLEKNMNDLKEAARRQEDFVGSFAHEIKTPLTSIIGYADILRSKKLDESTTFTAANYIFSEGKRLENLSIKLLELIVERKTQIKYKKISITKLIDDVLKITDRSLVEKEIKVDLDINSFYVNVDEDLMKTVLINLIDNARKAINIEGIIRIKAQKEEENIKIDIIDNGKGIPKKDLEKIKEAFYMVDKSRSRKEGGAGLGLTICTQIMKLHNGDMIYESELNKGTKVSLVWKEMKNEERN